MMLGIRAAKALLHLWFLLSFWYHGQVRSLSSPPPAQQAAQQKQRFRARVAYDGTGFSGFQLQRGTNKRTVQGCLEEVLSKRCNQSVRVVAAGRTDAGVHARGQAIHFDLLYKPEQQLEDDDELARIEDAVNKMLTSDICLWNLSRAPVPTQRTFETDHGTVTKELSWNVIYDSTKKLYSYRLSLSPVMDPLERHCRWHPDSQRGKPVDPVLLGKLLQCFEGTHDFRAFAGSVEQNEKLLGGDKKLNTVRTVYSVDLVDERNGQHINNDDDHTVGNYRIDFLLKGALYKQVRNMVGTAVDAARGVLPVEEFYRLIQDADTTTNGNNDANDDDSFEKNEPPSMSKKLTRDDNPSKPAPPEGLTLEHVYFDNDDEHWF